MDDASTPDERRTTTPSAGPPRSGSGMSRRRFSIVVALITVGTLLLLERQGVISRQTVHQWWPAGLILAGVWIAVLSWRR